MTFLAGDILTAQRINRLQPKPLFKQATTPLGASQTNVDIPGATLTFTTETDGALVQCSWSGDVNLTGSNTALNTVRAILDGVTVSDAFAVFRQAAGAANDRASAAAFHQFTIATAGSHTIKLQGTTGANTLINLYTVMNLLIFENA